MNLPAQLPPLVGVIMGSQSDWETMIHAAEILETLQIPYEKQVVSAHRTPQLMHSYAEQAAERGLKVIIAGAGGAAHLPGMVSGMTHLPVIGVPVQSKALNGMDSLLSIVQMPPGVPTATMAIGRAGAINAGLMAARILAISDTDIEQNVKAYMKQLTQDVLANPIPGATTGATTASPGTTAGGN